MVNEKCITGCNPKREAIDGNCTIPASDGLVARCGSAWTLKKHTIFEKYIGIFSNGMKKKFILNYIDLYSGPGFYFNRSTGKEHEGSPLLALKYEFNNFFFNDLSTQNTEALASRAKNKGTSSNIFNKDANEVAMEINKNIANNSLSFCLIDPNNMNDLKLNTIKELTRNKRVDILVNFAYGMDYRRSSKYILDEDSENKKFDEFFGTDEWREIEKKFNDKEDRFRAIALIDLYLSQLEKIDYVKYLEEDKHKFIFPIHGPNNALLYYLVFVSKHIRGYDFCKKIRPYTGEQQELI